jgi:hypothetical protein
VNEWAKALEWDRMKDTRDAFGPDRTFTPGLLWLV